MNADFYKLVRTLESLTEEKPETKKLENGKSVLKESSLKEMDKSQSSSDRGGESSGDPYAKGGKATPVTSKDMDKQALKTLNKSMDKAHKKDVKEQQQGVTEAAKWRDPKYRGVSFDYDDSYEGPGDARPGKLPLTRSGQRDLAGSARMQDPLAAREFYKKDTGKITTQDIEDTRDKNFGKEWYRESQGVAEAEKGDYLDYRAERLKQMQADAQQAAAAHSGAPIRRKAKDFISGLGSYGANYDTVHDFNIKGVKSLSTVLSGKVDPRWMMYAKEGLWTIEHDSDYPRAEWYTVTVTDPKHLHDFLWLANETNPNQEVIINSAQGVAEGSLEEVAPPRAKDERMVKHIKAGYAKDGKLTDVEKRKAYGAAWKAHNKSQVEEAADGPYYIVGIGRTSIRPVEVNSLFQAVADAKEMIAKGQNVQVKQGSPIGPTVSLDDVDTSSMPSREKDAARIAAYRQSRQTMKDKVLDAYLKKEMDLAKERDKLASRQIAQSEVDQLYAPTRVKPTAALAKPMEPQSKEKAPARTWREVDKDLMKRRTDKEYRRARAALRNPFGGLGVAESGEKVNEADVWRPGMPPPPNPDMGSSLPPREQRRVVTPQGPEGVQQPYVPSEPKKPVPKKTSDLGSEPEVAETADKNKSKRSDRLSVYQESVRYRTINKLIREEFDLENNEDQLSLEEKDLKAALGDELFNQLLAVKNDESEMSENLKDALFNFYSNAGEIPPEISKDQSQVDQYILDKIKSMGSNEASNPSDRLSVQEDKKVKGTRYGGAAQVDDEEDEDGETKAPAAQEKRGRGRPRKDSGDANTKAKYDGAKDLQSMIVGNVPKKSKSLEKLPATKHKLKGEE